MILRRIGALDEIERAVVMQSEWATPPAPLPTPPPAPKYEPQVIKKLLQTSGGRPEVRVPPYNPAYDSLPSNDRYDLYKVFEDGADVDRRSDRDRALGGLERPAQVPAAADTPG